MSKGFFGRATMSAGGNPTGVVDVINRVGKSL